MEFPKTPSEWETFGKNLIRVEYGPQNFKDMPDNHGGDFGIECYVLDGIAFQCYFPEQHSDLEKLYKAQRKKIYDDIKKLTESNIDKFKQLFVGMKISKWVLLTPHFKSSKLSLYTSKKSEKVRKLGLPYIDDDFSILVHTDMDYILSRNALFSSGQYQLPLIYESVDKPSVESWADGEDDFLEHLVKKLKFLNSDDLDKVHGLKVTLVQKYLTFQNLLSDLEQNWTDTYTKLDSCIKAQEDNLGLSDITGALAPQEKLNLELKEFEALLKSEIPNLSVKNIKTIIWGVIADWLIRCPLNFE